MATFAEMEGQYRALRGRLERGELGREQFLQLAAQLMCQDDAGRWWTIHPESGMWHYRWKDEWRPGVPPGHTPGAVLRATLPDRPAESAVPTVAVQASAEEKAVNLGGSPRWLIPVFAALALVVVVAVVVFSVLLPLLRGAQEQPKAEPTDRTQLPLAATFTPQPAATSLPETSLTPTASKTPEPTLSPTATLWPEGPDTADYRPEWPEALDDDFSQIGSGWSRGLGEGILVDYRDGQLRIELQGAGKIAWSRYDVEGFTNGWAAVTVVEMSPAGSVESPPAAGIAVHVTEDHHGYVFRIDGAGRYSIGRTLPDAEPPLVDWTFSEHIRTDGVPNRLAVLAERNRYSFFINGWLVGPEDGVGDESYATGLMALWGASGDSRAVRIAFDDALLLIGPDILSDEASPIATPTRITRAKTPTEIPKAAVTPTPETTLPPATVTVVTATPVVTLEPLAFDISYDSWYPGSGDSWIIRFSIQARGGDGQYTYTVADRTFTTDVFDFDWGCGSSLSTEIVVESGDGQRASKNQWVAHVQCVAP